MKRRDLLARSAAIILCMASGASAQQSIGGTISNLDTSNKRFTVGGMTFVYDSSTKIATPLANGKNVRVLYSVVPRRGNVAIQISAPASRSK